MILQNKLPETAELEMRRAVTFNATNSIVILYSDLRISVLRDVWQEIWRPTVRSLDSVAGILVTNDGGRRVTVED